MQTNRIDKKGFTHQTRKINGKFIVSGRRIQQDISMLNYLKIYYTYLQQDHIDSVFGFALDYIPLYGGRSRSKGGLLTQKHLDQMNELGVHLSLTMTNHFFSENAYEASRPLLETLHRKGNSITCANDELAGRIRKDFPEFSLTASLIMGLGTLDKVRKALDLYDHVVIPMEKNDDDVFLESLPEKKRVILFGNANCAYNCPDRICYRAISNQFASKETSQHTVCSKGPRQREKMPHVFFNIEKFETMGFKSFKLIPDNSPVFNSLVRQFSTTASTDKIQTFFHE